MNPRHAVRSSPHPAGRAGAVIVLLGAVAGGCFSSKQPPVMKYFRLPIWEGVKAPAAEPLPAVIQVEALDVLPAYDHLRIVYRVTPVQLRHYRFRQWVVKPGRLFRESLQRFLEASGRFKEVTATSRPIPNYVLRGQVISVEQVEKGSKQQKWFAHLELRLGLYRAADEKEVWRLRIKTRSRVEERTPQNVVDTLTRDFRKKMQAALPALVRAVKTDLASR